ncbi:MAG: hypothetical protein HQ519_13345 [Planctomycetes bacterium]|nr:hypothetical protein [Planctomycetota bacterium]
MKPRLPLIIAVTLLFTNEGLQGQVWKQQSPVPADTDLFGVEFLTADHGFAVGDDQLFIETLDGGATWTQVAEVQRNPKFLEEPFWDLHFHDALNGWVVGNDSDAWRTMDGGQSWQQMTSLPYGSYAPIDFVSPTHGWVGSNESMIRTRDGGQSWDVLTDWLQEGMVVGMDFRDTQVGMFSNFPITGNWVQGIYLTTDSGDNWTLSYSGGAGQILFLDANTVIAIAAGGITRTTDLGQTWTTHAVSWPYSIADWQRIDANTVVAVANGGSIHRSIDGGRNWTQLYAGTGVLGGGGDWAISFPTPSIGRVVGPQGYMMESTDGGQTWRQSSHGLALDRWLDISMHDAFYGIAVGWAGSLVRTHDGGENWIAGILDPSGAPFVYAQDLECVSIVNRDVAYVGGDFGTVYRTNDGARSWTSIGYPALPEMYVYGIDFVDSDTGWVVGQSGTTYFGKIYTTTDSGGSWVDRSPNPNSVWNDVDFFDANEGWICGSNDFVWHTFDGGLNWNPVSVPATSGYAWENIEFAPEDHQVGWILSRFKTARTDDGGATWSVLNLPGLPANENPLDMDVVSADEAWISTGPDGYVLHTLDGGQNWTKTLVGIGPASSLDSIAAVPGNKAWTGGLYGRIFASDPPGPNDIYLARTLLNRGLPAEFITYGAQPGETVHFAYSLAGTGFGPRVSRLGGLRLDLLNPVVLFGSELANLEGTAAVTVSVPPNMPLIPVSTQSVIRRGSTGSESVKSNADTVIVHD